ncbi:hypothetical protein CGRA01v4_07343 [Colletotrichum graminicola]|nr:hypothetical protein CGRA01v4_07343 [Colletotrichum graminicola]
MAPPKVIEPGALPGVPVADSSQINACVQFFSPPAEDSNQGPLTSWSYGQVLSRISNALKPCTQCPVSRQLRPRNSPRVGAHRPVPLGPVISDDCGSGGSWLSRSLLTTALSVSPAGKSCLVILFGTAVYCLSMDILL